jgi:hypothetical protein
LLTGEKEKPSISQKKKLKEQDEIEELQRIKNRLKGEHKQKMLNDKDENKYED